MSIFNNRKSKYIKLTLLIFGFFALAIISKFIPVRKIITKKAAVIGDTALSLQPNTGSILVGQTFPLEIIINNTNQKKISFVDIRINFDKTKMEIVGFVPNPLTFPIDITQNDSSLLGTINGRAVFKAGNSGADLAESAVINAGKIFLRGKEAGTAAVNFDIDNSQLAGEGVGNDVLLSISGSSGGSYTFTAEVVPTPTVTLTPVPTPTATETPTPTLTPTLTPTPTVTPRIWVNFSVKFQGIDRQAEDQTVKVKLVKSTGANEINETLLIADTAGVYSGRVGFRTPIAGDDLMIFIKGPRHLSKRFCEDYDQSRCTGRRYVTIQDGENNFDFSKARLEAGDLPNPNDTYQQDGVVNSVDYVLINGRLGSSDGDDLRVADLNSDGIVNSVDRLLLRNTLEARYEEDE